MATHADLPRPDSLTLGDNTAEERRRAALVVAARAHDENDCQQLLDELGLLPAATPRPRRKRTTRPTTTHADYPTTTREVTS